MLDKHLNEIQCNCQTSETSDNGNVREVTSSQTNNTQYKIKIFSLIFNTSFNVTQLTGNMYVIKQLQNCIVLLDFVYLKFFSTLRRNYARRNLTMRVVCKLYKLLISLFKNLKLCRICYGNE